MKKIWIILVVLSTLLLGIVLGKYLDWNKIFNKNEPKLSDSQLNTLTMEHSKRKR